VAQRLHPFDAEIRIAEDARLAVEIVVFDPLDARQDLPERLEGLCQPRPERREFSARPRIPCRRGRQRGHKFARIYRVLTTAKLEMQLRLADIAGRADPRDDLAAPDFFAPLDQNRIAVGISRDPAIGMLDENEIAVPAQLVPGIGDDAGVDGLNCSAAGRRDVDAIIVCAVRF
jgi:hypothetical protein